MDQDQVQQDVEALDQTADQGRGEDRDDLVTYPFQDADGKNLSADEAKEAAEDGSLHLPLIYSLRYPVEIKGKTNNKVLKTLGEVKIHHRLSGKALREGMNLGKTGDQTAYFIGAATGLQQYELDQLDGYDYFQLTKVVNGFLPGGNESAGELVAVRLARDLHFRPADALALDDVEARWWLEGLITLNEAEKDAVKREVG